jgi:hypothetical protein
MTFNTCRRSWCILLIAAPRWPSIPPWIGNLFHLWVAGPQTTQTPCLGSTGIVTAWLRKGYTVRKMRARCVPGQVDTGPFGPDPGGDVAPCEMRDPAPTCHAQVVQIAFASALAPHSVVMPLAWDPRRCQPPGGRIAAGARADPCQAGPWMWRSRERPAMKLLLAPRPRR